MKHIAIVYGTRPQVIKLAPLVKELDKHRDKLKYTLINTGQHYDENMDGVFHKQLGIREPDYNMDSMLRLDGERTKMPPSYRLSAMITYASDYLDREKPDLVVVIGDTDSTLAGALAANKMGIPVAHIEAGVRSGDRSQPEEINRILVDQIADFHFIPDGRCASVVDYTSGVCNQCDLMLDAFLMYKDKAIKEVDDLEGKYPVKFNLLTLHRANLTGDFISEVMRAIDFIGIPTVWPMHPGALKKFKGIKKPVILQVVEPVGYFEMLWLVQNANHILTDSGGLVREAGFAGKKCTILRTESEWSGDTLRRYDALSILNNVNYLLHKLSTGVQRSPNWFVSHGEGKASETIVNAIFDYLNIQDEPNSQ